MAIGLIALLAPAGAQAARVHVDADPFADRVRFEAQAGEASDLTVSGDDEALTFVDAGAPISAGEGCNGGGGVGVPVVCPRQGVHTASLLITLGDLADAVDTTAVSLSSPLFFIGIEGNGGGDAILGGVESERVIPGKGPDRVSTGAGSDRWEQRFHNPDAADSFDGGHGEDTVAYRTKYGVHVRLDGIANDGGRGEGDDIVGTENVVTAVRADLLAGDRRDNELEGGGGRDRVLGGRGNDVIEGGAGRDSLHGGRGDDVINAKRHGLGEPSGRDLVDCGPGDDIAIVQAGDRVRDCETVRR